MQRETARLWMGVLAGLVGMNLVGARCVRAVHRSNHAAESFSVVRTPRPIPAPVREVVPPPARVTPPTEVLPPGRGPIEEQLGGAGPLPSITVNVSDPELSFSTSGRWAFIVDDPGSTVVVVDRTTGSSMAAAGNLLRRGVASVGGYVAEDEISDRNPGAAWLDGTERFAVLSTEQSLRVLDLQTRRLAYRSSGSALREVHWNGPSVLVWASGNAVHSLNVHTGMHRRWTATMLVPETLRSDSSGNTMWFERDGAVHVVRTREHAALQSYRWRGHTPRSVAVSTMGNAVAVSYEERGVAAFVLGTESPVWRTDAVGMDLLWNSDGTKLAWVRERSLDSNDEEGRTALRITTIHGGNTLEFFSQTSCPIASEQPAAFTDGVLETTLVCSPGCPSLSMSEDHYYYDERTGAQARAPSARVWGSHVDEQGRRLAIATRVLRVQRAEGEVFLAPENTSALVHAREGLRWVSARGALRRRLEDSSAQSLDAVGMGGEHSVLGIDDHGIARLWSLETGRVVWSQQVRLAEAPSQR